MATATGGEEDGSRSPHLLRHCLGFLRVFEEDFKEKTLARRLGLLNALLDKTYYEMQIKYSNAHEGLKSKHFYLAVLNSAARASNLL
uniref:Uncharacterized protein n=1 Tax=Oryza nivara TaxID=4536 RepID=A0A0E0GRJ2_ORYNI